MWNISRPSMHVHVISMTLFWSRGTSFANSLLSGANMSSPRVARFREGFERGSCINFRQQPLRTNKSQWTRTFSESFVTFVQQSDTIASSCHIQQDFVGEQALPGQISCSSSQGKGWRTSQGIVDTTTVHQGSRTMSCFCVSVLQVNLPKQNFIQARPYADSIVIAVCRCLSFCCTRRSCQTFQKNQVAGYARHGNSSTFAMKTSCLLCDVPIRQVVHFASVLVTTVSDERRFWVARWPTQSLYVANWSHHNRVHRGFRFLSHQQWQMRQELLHTLHTHTKAIGQSRLEVETGFLSRRPCHGKLLSEISFHVLCEHRSQIHTMSWCVCRSFAWFVRRIACAHACLPCCSFMQFVDFVKDLLPECWVTAREYEIINLHHPRGLNDTVFVSKSPQGRFHDRFFRFPSFEDRRQLGDTIFLEHWPSRILLSTSEHSDGAPTATFVTTREFVHRTCRKLAVLTQFWNYRHRLWCPQLVRPNHFEATHISRFVYEYEKQVKQ